MVERFRNMSKPFYVKFDFSGNTFIFIWRVEIVSRFRSIKKLVNKLLDANHVRIKPHGYIKNFIFVKKW